MIEASSVWIEEEAPVHYYAMHAEEWRAAAGWPVTEDGAQYFLGARNTLEEAGNGSAGEAEPGGVVGYQVDFGTGTGRNTRYERIAGKSVGGYYCDWQGRSGRHLVFDSAPLRAPLDLSGHGMVSLELASSQPDAGVFIYLTEVEEDSTERYVTEGLLRLLHRAESAHPQEIVTAWPYRSFRREDAQPMRPETPETVRIPLLPTAWRFSVGSRIRLSLAGADQDHATQYPHGRPPLLRVGLGAEASQLWLPDEHRGDEDGHVRRD